MRGSGRLLVRPLVATGVEDAGNGHVPWSRAAPSGGRHTHAGVAPAPKSTNRSPEPPTGKSAAPSLRTRPGMRWDPAAVRIDRGEFALWSRLPRLWISGGGSVRPFQGQQRWRCLPVRQDNWQRSFRQCALPKARRADRGWDMWKTTGRTNPDTARAAGHWQSAPGPPGPAQLCWTAAVPANNCAAEEHSAAGMLRDQLGKGMPPDNPGPAEGNLGTETPADQPGKGSEALKVPREGVSPGQETPVNQFTKPLDSMTVLS